MFSSYFSSNFIFNLNDPFFVSILAIISSKMSQDLLRVLASSYQDTDYWHSDEIFQFVFCTQHHTRKTLEKEKNT